MRPRYPFFEIDFPPIEGKQSGEAILIRAGWVDSQRKILDSKVWLIDGGFRSTAEYILKFVDKYYGSTKIDYIIATHTDNDHIEGLAQIIEHAYVGKLYMHDPSKHGVVAYVQNQNSSSYSRKSDAGENECPERRLLIASLKEADNLIDKAKKKNITTCEPFCFPNSAEKIDTGYDFLRVYILGPDEGYYKELLSQFRDYEKYLRTAKFFSELSSNQFLQDPLPEATTPENNSSVILLFDFQGDYFLFTGDAGVPALERAFARFPEGDSGTRQILLFKVPHHGSKNNLGPSLLDKVDEAFGSNTRRKWAIVLAGDQDLGHPDKVVIDALWARGFEVYANKYQSERGFLGQHLWFKNAHVPPRAQQVWKPAPLYNAQRLYPEHTTYALMVPANGACI
ncbi:MAG: MBL fold metallo-hydrolase [Bacteroidia bacterium]